MAINLDEDRDEAYSRRENERKINLLAGFFAIVLILAGLIIVLLHPLYSLWGIFSLAIGILLALYWYYSRDKNTETKKQYTLQKK